MIKKSWQIQSRVVSDRTELVYSVYEFFINVILQNSHSVSTSHFLKLFASISSSVLEVKAVCQHAVNYAQHFNQLSEQNLKAKQWDAESDLILDTQEVQTQLSSYVTQLSSSSFSIQLSGFSIELSDLNQESCIKINCSQVNDF